MLSRRCSEVKVLTVGIGFVMWCYSLIRFYRHRVALVTRLLTSRLSNVSLLLLKLPGAFCFSMLFLFWFYFVPMSPSYVPCAMYVSAIVVTFKNISYSNLLLNFCIVFISCLVSNLNHR